LLYERQVGLRVPAAERFCLGSRGEPIGGVLADGGQHRKSWFLDGARHWPHQADLGEGNQTVEDLPPELVGRAADRLGLDEARSAREDAEPLEEVPVRRLQELVAPVDAAP
jgi:hypothetical protein